MRGGPTIKHLDDVLSQEMSRIKFADGLAVAEPSSRELEQSHV